MIALAETGGVRTPLEPEIEPLCARYNAECVKLEDLMADLEADLAAVKDRHLRTLKRQAALVAAGEAELHQAVAASPQMFVKPRTTILHGTKIGYLNSVGSVTYADEARVVQLIGKHFPDRLEELVKTERTPRKDALRTLTGPELARLGCRIEGAGDLIVVKRVAGDVEKLINKLIEKLVTAMVAG
jgi:hypothetical protein